MFLFRGTQPMEFFPTTSNRLAHYHYENEFNLHVNEKFYSYKTVSTRTHFENETKDNTKMGYWNKIIVFYLLTAVLLALNLLWLHSELDIERL